MKIIDKLLLVIRQWQNRRCAAQGHNWYTDETISRRPLPDHEHNNADFEIFEHTKVCAECGVTYTRPFSSFRGGFEEFLKRES